MCCPLLRGTALLVGVVAAIALVGACELVEPPAHHDPPEEDPEPEIEPEPPAEPEPDPPQEPEPPGPEPPQEPDPPDEPADPPEPPAQREQWRQLAAVMAPTPFPGGIPTQYEHEFMDISKYGACTVFKLSVTHPDGKTLYAIFIACDASPAPANNTDGAFQVAAYCAYISPEGPLHTYILQAGAFTPNVKFANEADGTRTHYVKTSITVRDTTSSFQNSVWLQGYQLASHGGEYQLLPNLHGFSSIGSIREMRYRIDTSEGVIRFQEEDGQALEDYETRCNGSVQTPAPEPVLPWVPDHVIRVSMWKNPERPWCLWCDPETDYAGREVSDQEWLTMVQYTNEIFSRSAIRVQILTEKTPGVVDVKVTFWRGYPGGGIAWAQRSLDPEHPRLLCPNPCKIDFYMGWQGSGPGYGWDYEPWLGFAAETLAHELVHIVGPWEFDQCGHRLGDGSQTAHLPARWYDHGLQRLTDYVRDNCFAGLPPWEIPERYH